MQKILSSINAATGIQLKQSVNIFHNLMLYLLLPFPENIQYFFKIGIKNKNNIHHKIHIFD